MLSVLRNADRELLLLINGHHSPFWDQVMLNVSGKLFWLPLYAVLLAGLIFHYRVKVIPVLLAIAFCITAADQISSSILKELVHRSRPCHSLLLQDQLHFSEACGGPYGFVSSHAANAFGLCVLLWLLFRRRYPGVGWLFVWSLLIGYSRVYLAAHYPLDVIGGYLVGAFSAGVAYKLYVAFGHRLRWLKTDDLRLKAKGWA